MQSVTLIIDKRLELSTKYKKLLEDANNCVIITKDILSAIKIIQEKEPDLILISDSVDNDLSDYCKKIRGLTYNMRPVIVAVSKSDDIQDRLTVLQNGADDFISEPVNSEEFVMRIKAHLRREYESNLNDEYLLPNKRCTLRSLKRLIISDKKWGALLISIDNFDNYREAYSELASDKLIRTFCALMSSALSESDFVGQISDNEFVILTDMYKSERIANYLIFAFDSVSSKFYSQNDLQRGYMILRGDNYAGQRSDFVHISIGIVTNEYNDYENVGRLINELVQTKDMAVKNDKSSYLIERQKISAENATFAREYNNKITIMESDEALSLLLKTLLELQGYVVVDKDESPALIILDSGESDENLNLCKLIKNDEKFKSTKIIVTSVTHDKETVLDTCADLYVPKPYEISYLVKWVDKFIKEFNR